MGRGPQGSCSSSAQPPAAANRRKEHCLGTVPRADLPPGHLSFHPQGSPRSRRSCLHLIQEGQRLGEVRMPPGPGPNPGCRELQKRCSFPHRCSSSEQQALPLFSEWFWFKAELATATQEGASSSTGQQAPPTVTPLHSPCTFDAALCRDLSMPAASHSFPGTCWAPLPSSPATGLTCSGRGAAGRLPPQAWPVPTLHMSPSLSLPSEARY